MTQATDFKSGTGSSSPTVRTRTTSRCSCCSHKAARTVAQRRVPPRPKAICGVRYDTRACTGHWCGMISCVCWENVATSASSGCFLQVRASTSRASRPAGLWMRLPCLLPRPWHEAAAAMPCKDTTTYSVHTAARIQSTMQVGSQLQSIKSLLCKPLLPSVHQSTKSLARNLALNRRAS